MFNPNNLFLRYIKKRQENFIYLIVLNLDVLQKNETQLKNDLFELKRVFFS